MKQLDNQGGSYKKIMKDFLPLYNANDVLKNSQDVTDSTDT